MDSRPNIEDSIGFALHHASYLFKSAMKNAFLANGIDVTPEEMVILFMVQDDGSDQSELVKKSLKDKTNITRLLSRMVKKQLIKRTNHKDNGRQQMVFLTDSGVKTRMALLPVVMEIAAKASKGIKADELKAASSTLSKIAHNLK